MALSGGDIPPRADDVLGQGTRFIPGASSGEGLKRCRRSRHSPTEIATESGADVILLGGDPLDAPIVRHGPFVMNSSAEIA
jgi:redox-sensitive bicupin YhaK (pirin superfamily)